MLAPAVPQHGTTAIHSADGVRVRTGCAQDNWCLREPAVMSFVESPWWVQANLRETQAKKQEALPFSWSPRAEEPGSMVLHPKLI